MKSNTLPLSVTLKDLAILRASEVDLSQVLEPSKPTEYDESLQRSLEFAKEARKALKLANNGSIEHQGSRIDEVRALGEEILAVLESKENASW
ncbi:hypothetical protein CPB86DRAFT_714552 [Serendipita vermifera]|nr:hypothetical protein CPB86DRAFT_714552 [Serendipita vermifera]